MKAKTTEIVLGLLVLGLMDHACNGGKVCKTLVTAARANILGR